MNASLNNFNQLCNSIRKAAIRDLKQKRTSSQSAKWQRLLSAILETELTMHRVRSALNLLKTIPSEETLNLFSMSEGAWIDYQYTTWSFWMFGLLERGRSLFKLVIRNLVKPSNPQYKDMEKTLLKSIEVQRDKISKVRHPLAHIGEGGTIEEVTNTELWKNFVILPSPIDFNQILASLVPYRVRWHYFLHQVSMAVFTEIERVSGELIKHINWEKV